MIPFHYEITGLRRKKLPLRWELSNAATNDLVAAENSAYRWSRRTTTTPATGRYGCLRRSRARTTT